jgi:hypothetical protein
MAADVNQLRGRSGKDHGVVESIVYRSPAEHQESISPSPPTLDGASAHSALTPAIAPSSRSYPTQWSVAVSVSSTPTPTCAQTRSSTHSPRTFT